MRALDKDSPVIGTFLIIIFQDAATAKAGRSPATKRKKMTKDPNSPKFAAPQPKKR